ncbi:MAG: methionyl-tRNA formyltransferase [Chloroflexi bacterium]|nr:methionyl-tRNA formyltransferase [Chloroflexota bacterium]
MSQDRPRQRPKDGALRVVFMGTPRFAAPVLEALNASADVNLCGVFTPPDRSGGRGRLPISPPVKLHALELGLEVHQPPTLRSQQAQALLASLEPDVIVVAAYGRFLPPPVLNLPPGGCLNLHPSLLPRHRGPSPVVTTILEGDSATGVSLMLLDQGMDTGPVIAIRGHQMGGNETAEALTEELFRIGSGLLMENLGPWAQGELTARPQNDDDATVTRKVERDDGRADWSLSAVELERRFRAYTPWPGLYSQWDGKLIKFLDVASLTDESGQGLPAGSVVHLSGPVPLGVVTGSGILALKTVQLEGRNSATAADFLRGYPGIAGALL